MKEASGEASLTVITIILIAAVLAAATIILNSVMGNVQKQAESVTNGEATGAISSIISLD